MTPDEEIPKLLRAFRWFFTATWPLIGLAYMALLGEGIRDSNWVLGIVGAVGWLWCMTEWRKLLWRR